MLKKLYSIAGFMLALSAFHVAQGMDERGLGAELKVENEKLAEQLAKTKFNSVINELQGIHLDWITPESLNYLEQQREYAFQTVLLNLKPLAERERKAFEENKNKFQAVLNVISQNDMKYYSSDDFKLLQDKRDQVLQELLNAQDASEEVQGCELPEGLEQAFEELFGLEVDQDQACEKLLKSIVGMENLLDQEVTSIEPVKVGWGTSLLDWWYGSKNLVNELAADKLPLEVLKKSPDMQNRINGMIASYSPSKKRNPEALQSLVDIYSSLDQLNFKFVNADVNSDIYNVCDQWQRDEEAQYIATRKTAVGVIAKLLVQEMKKLRKEEAPRIATIEKLEQIQALALKTGMVGEVAQVDNNAQKEISSTKILDMVSRLEELSESLIQEEEFKKLFA